MQYLLVVKKKIFFCNKSLAHFSLWALTSMTMLHVTRKVDLEIPAELGTSLPRMGQEISSGTRKGAKFGIIGWNRFALIYIYYTTSLDITSTIALWVFDCDCTFDLNFFPIPYLEILVLVGWFCLYFFPDHYFSLKIWD